MIRSTWLLTIPTLLGLAACNVSTDQQNDQTVLSVNHDAIENGVEAAGNTAERAADKTGDALEKAVPVIESTARNAGAAAERAVDQAGNTIERVDVDVNVREANQQQGR
ncbi:hypothetical protein [Sphingomonas arenae]|uniref:hypothetical protein n=1 Tax=Sphingomonas arenae TaxID=2812555 RepID=UPI001966FE8E|nr:hypothetical protein [Sphingomonas arenae]